MCKRQQYLQKPGSICERACLVQELREWLEQWVTGRVSQMLTVIKVGLALKVTLTSSVGKVESPMDVRLGSGIEKWHCLLFALLCSVDFQES